MHLSVLEVKNLKRDKNQETRREPLCFLVNLYVIVINRQKAIGNSTLRLCVLAVKYLITKHLTSISLQFNIQIFKHRKVKIIFIKI